TATSRIPAAPLGTAGFCFRPASNCGKHFLDHHVRAPSDFLDLSGAAARRSAQEIPIGFFPEGHKQIEISSTM
ncbi:MAG TPA: hypothetical protein VFQ06_09395, partial [Nitrospira sp.]|nr:hypothetical protein [Nitrospira sp.]